jgi:CheY-like chemotaxis protein
MRKILVVEDDYLARDWMCAALRNAFGNDAVGEIANELEFQTRFQEILEVPPAIIVMDMLLPWTSPAPNLQPPPERVDREGIYTAGLRCKEMLEKDHRTRNIKVLFYTVLSRDDLLARLGSETDTLTYLQKDSNLDTLIARIRELVDPASSSELVH